MSATQPLSKIIALAAKITAMRPVTVAGTEMVELTLEGKEYTISVMPAFVNHHKPEVGMMLVKYDDRMLGCLTQEEFEEIKKEGKHHGL